ncbi:MAG: 3-isopropylmalate dehydratase large subunit [Tindallia sp. MSAO_Bac2]|nr:MAG: 3-isopropylmalate dehydratase large subunit [Tindallia sp. MSAO_Bac2]
MGMTITEKILSRIMDKPVKAGETIYPEPDMTIVHDGYVVPLYNDLQNLGVKEIINPEKMMFVTDHEVFPVSQKAADKSKKIKEIAKELKIGKHYDSGRGGIGHVAPVEDGYIKPGMFIKAYDTHCPNFGAVGALAFPIFGDVLSVAVKGSTWITVPETIKIVLAGKLKEGVTIRDLSQYIISKIDPEIANYSVIEFAGPALNEISIDGRMTLCNVPLEIGPKSIIFPSDDITKNYYKGEIEEVYSDEDANYKETFQFDLSLIKPQVSLPSAPENVVDVDQVIGKNITHAFIGSCASGMIDDMRMAASILKNNKIHSDVNLYIVPASQEVYSKMAQEGLVDIFIKADSIILPPGCGPCAGGKIGTLAKNEVSISTATRNDPGRMGGGNSSELYLASPLTVAASAVNGKITNPSNYSSRRDVYDL